MLGNKPFPMNLFSLQILWSVLCLCLIFICDLAALNYFFGRNAVTIAHVKLFFQRSWPIGLFSGSS